MAISFENQAVVVTGAGRGIGRATALALVKRGASVVVADLDADKCAEVVEEIAAQGGKAVAAAGSIAEWDVCGQVIDAALTSFGRIDGLINNAGYLAKKSIWELDPPEFEAAIGVHVFGTYYTTRIAVPHMLKQGYGRIVNVVSRAGLVGAAECAAYGASKAGIFGFTNAVARDLAGTGINVNSFNPASTATRLTFDDQPPEVLERLKVIAQGPEHVAEVATFLASKDCDFSGQSLYAQKGAVGPFDPVDASRYAYTTADIFTAEEMAGIMPKFNFPKLAKSLYAPDKKG